MKTVITEARARFIRENYLKMSGIKISRILGVYKSSIYRFLEKEKLIVPKDLVEQWQKERIKRELSEKEKLFVIAHIPDYDTKQIAKMLGIGNRTLYREALKMGLGQQMKEKKEKNQFKKGDIPHNKFPEGLKEAITQLNKIQKALKI